MAKVESIVKIRGAIGDLSFRKTEFGMEVGRKTGPTREKVLTADSFEFTRRNANEFRLATKNSKLLRYALDSSLDGVRCSGLNGHMNGLFRRMSLLDPKKDYGFRHVSGNNVQLMEGFSFNKKLHLDKVLPVAMEHSMDAAAGQTRLTIPSCIIRKKKKLVPDEATHIRFVSCAAMVDFGNNNYAQCIQRSGLFCLSRKMPAAVSFEHTIKTLPGEVLLQVAGIEFYKMHQGQEVLLKGGALQILAVHFCEGITELPADTTDQVSINEEDTIALIKRELQSACCHFTRLQDRASKVALRLIRETTATCCRNQRQRPDRR